MLIIMRSNSSADQIKAVTQHIKDLGLESHVIPGENRTAIGITGNKGALSADEFSGLGGVVKCIPVTKPYKLISREVKPNDTIIEVDGATIGGSEPTLIAGPCSVETEDRVMEIAGIIAGQGLKFFRGGAYKPRTSPYSFQGLGEGGLELLRKVKSEYGLRTVTEVLEPDAAELAADYVDILQIGTRNMYNYPLLKKVGELDKPVLLKRGLSATLEEFLFAAEYIASHGNFNIILCERGIRTFSDYARNTFDINVIPVVRQISHLPIIADPSHACGDRRHVLPLARAALAAGANGLVVEVHQDPETAYSDGAQSLYPMQLQQLQNDVGVIQEMTSQD